MRFAEKSFEIRFCAAFSAAVMPFNRNPQWFGMTQAQERITGIDTMLKIGGNLTIFQFKAKRRDKFHLEKSQWRNLVRIEKRYPNSTYYVFPEAAEARAAASVSCILKHSWCCSVSDLGQGFKRAAASTTLSLKPSHASLVKARPKASITVQQACKTFGCFCPPLMQEIIICVRPQRHTFIYFSTRGEDEVRADQPLPPFAEKLLGIPLGDVSCEGDDNQPLTSVKEFEEIMGEGANSNLTPGTFGLFLPHARPMEQT